MTDELDVVAGLTPEQVVERAKAGALELEYWRHILTDLEVVNGGIRDGAMAILDSTASALELAALGHSAALGPVGTIIAENRKALDAVKVVSDALGRMLELADGRSKALAPVADALLRAAGAERDDEPGSEAS